MEELELPLNHIIIIHMILTGTKLPFLPINNPKIPTRTRTRTRTRRRGSGLRTHSSLDDAFRALTSLDFVPAAVAAAAASASATSAVFLSRIRPPEPDPAVVEWVLFTSPIPFLRCPSVLFEDDGGGDRERLLAEERHYVNLTCGMVSASDVRESAASAKEGVAYQRVYVGTEDGGVVSLDWQESLDIGKEYELDMTVLVVPGTAEGSMDGDVGREYGWGREAVRGGCAEERVLSYCEEEL